MALVGGAGSVGALKKSCCAAKPPAATAATSATQVDVDTAVSEPAAPAVLAAVPLAAAVDAVAIAALPATVERIFSRIRLCACAEGPAESLRAASSSALV